MLVTQDDHARLSGRLAELVGNETFAAPSPAAVRGVGLHDCGWPLHDDSPTLNRRGEPLHVLESPMKITTAVWGESARRAAAADPYAGLLVSLHVLHLSAIASKHDATPHERYETRHDLFLLNRFQQQEIERQDDLRRRVGLRTDLRLILGLAEPGTSGEEDLLRFDYQLLKLLDAFSLDACCAEPLFPKVEGVHPRPGARPVDVRIEHPGEGALAVAPWPFGIGKVELTVPSRRLTARHFKEEGDFRDAFGAAPVEAYPVRISPL